MYEKLVEHWLTEVNELGYQLPFCEVLVAEGYTILHVSTHGRGEHGKDVVARSPDGGLATFQLKGGSIALPEWRRIRGEVAELVELPVRVPGVSENEPHTPHLVTNGEVRGDALESISRYSATWEKRGARGLQVWQRGALLRKFVDAHGAYLSSSRADFRRFVQLYTLAFDDRLPKEKFAPFLMDLVDTPVIGQKPRQNLRAIASLAIMANYVLEQYERERNFVSAMEGWTMVASAIFHAAERDLLPPAVYEPSLALVRSALERNLAAFRDEVFASENFIGSRPSLAESYIYGARVVLTLGWVSTALLYFHFTGAERLPVSEIRRLVRREVPAMKLAGESDWPAIMSLALLAECALGSANAERVCELWVRFITAANAGDKPVGVAPPYWSQEKAIAKAFGLLSPIDDEDFSGHSYSVLPALDMLVRRLRRMLVKTLWPTASRLHFCDFAPDRHCDWFAWRSETGALNLQDAQQPMSWSAWRGDAMDVSASKIPACLVRHPEWLLPFALTYPHRANRSLCGAIDAIVGRHAKMSSL